MLERSLILLKPDCVQRQFCGELITRFEKAGFKIVAMKMLNKDADHYEKHYYDVKERHGEAILKRNQHSMTLGPVVAMVLEGANAIETIRKMVGATEPKQALPGTIRGDYAHQSYAIADNNDTGIRNLIHASANQKDAEHEIALWFTPEELHSYKTVHEVHLF